MILFVKAEHCSFISLKAAKLVDSVRTSIKPIKIVKKSADSNCSLWVGPTLQYNFLTHRLVFNISVFPPEYLYSVTLYWRPIKWGCGLGGSRGCLLWLTIWFHCCRNTKFTRERLSRKSNNCICDLELQYCWTREGQYHLFPILWVICVRLAFGTANKGSL